MILLTQNIDFYQLSFDLLNWVQEILCTEKANLGRDLPIKKLKRIISIARCTLISHMAAPMLLRVT